MRFLDVIGQKSIIKKLISSIRNNRVSHAQLFLGKNGYGTYALALAYAQYINCENQFDDDSCGRCSNCLKMLKLEHPDVHFTFPIIASDHIKTSKLFAKEWIKFSLNNKYFDLANWYKYIKKTDKTGGIYVSEANDINKKIHLKPSIGKYKIVVIWQADMMNLEVSNKLLKNIEEPPSKTIFILISEKEEKLLTTIKSRTQLIKIPAIENEKLKNQLLKTTTTHIDINDIVKVAEGDYIKAKALLDNDNNEFFNEFISWMRFCVKKDVYSVVQWVKNFTNNGKEFQKEFLIYCLHFFRQALVKNYNDDELVRIIGEEAKFNANFTNFIHHENIMKLHELFNEAYTHIDRNGNQKIIFLDLSFHIFKILKKPILQ